MEEENKEKENKDNNTTEDVASKESASTEENKSQGTTGGEESTPEAVESNSDTEDSQAQNDATLTDKPLAPGEEQAGEEDELTGIEEETEQEIVQKVTKKKKQRKKRSDKRGDKAKEGSEWIEKVVQIRRVTKVVKGGKKLSFRAVVIAGNAKGQVGVGVGKASEVIGAIQKGISDAKKSAVNVSLLNSTIPHTIIGRAGSAKVFLKPAREGTGIIAGGAARTVLELGGVGDILAKSLGSRSPLNVARATLDGLSNLRKFDSVASLRGLSMREMLGIEGTKITEGAS